MMNRNEKLEIAKRLRHSEEMEMSCDDLEALMEAELNKPKDEMDTELVQQILELLEEAPSQVQQHDAWEKTHNRLKFKQWQPVVFRSCSVTKTAFSMCISRATESWRQESV